MNHISISLMIILHSYEIFKKSVYTEEYLENSNSKLSMEETTKFIMSLLVMHLSGVERISHYEACHKDSISAISGHFQILRAKKLRLLLSQVPGTMLTWKMLLLQRRLVDENSKEVLNGKYGSVLDIDGMSMVSYSKNREGSDYGHSKKFKGRRLIQMSGSFIGKTFIDCKLFPGYFNTATYFKKAVNRAKSLGYFFDKVRADTAYGHAENLLFLEKLSLQYAIGIKTYFKAIRRGKELFKKLARKSSYKITHVKKGIAILDLGLVNVASVESDTPILRRVIICRRIHRRKKHGKLKIKRYYYAIVTNLEWTPTKVYNFYMQRQCIENGFKELRYHFYINNFCRNGKNSLKINEFWVTSKIFAMTLYKLFTHICIAKRLSSMRRNTLVRYLFANTIRFIHDGKVVLLRNHKNLWALQRILSNLRKNTSLGNTFYIVT